MPAEHNPEPEILRPHIHVEHIPLLDFLTKHDGLRLKRDQNVLAQTILVPPDNNKRMVFFYTPHPHFGLKAGPWEYMFFDKSESALEQTGIVRDGWLAEYSKIHMDKGDEIPTPQIYKQTLEQPDRLLNIDGVPMSTTQHARMLPGITRTIITANRIYPEHLADRLERDGRMQEFLDFAEGIDPSHLLAFK